MSILFLESPIIGYGTILAILLACAVDSRVSIGAGIILLIFLLYFYRWSPTDIALDDNQIISPCEGTVITVLDKHDHYYIPIFLSPMNKHTQIYPAN